MTRHSKTVKILDKTITAPTLIEDISSLITDVEIFDTGSEKTDYGIITLKIPESKKYVLSSPVLVGDPTQPHNQQPKDRYLIEAYLNQGLTLSNESKHLRGYITTTEQDQNQNGNYLKLWVRGQFYRAKQILVSRNHKFFTPSDALSLWLTDYSLQITPNLNTPAISIATNNLPTDERLKQNYLPPIPIPLYDGIELILKRLADPGVSGGAFDDYYVTAEPDPASTRNLLLTADVFGAADSGVKISAQTFTPLETKKVVTDNMKYFNGIILKGGPRGRLPTQSQIFASHFDHARRRPTWDSVVTYGLGDLVQTGNRYFRSLAASNTNNFPLSTLGVWWTEDFTVDKSASPWTNSDVLEDWKSNLGGFVIAPATGHVGTFVDPNFVRANYDRSEFTNDYENITLKSVKAFQSDPPTGSLLFDGQRVLIPPSGGTSGAFLGKANQLAEWSEADNEWKFSNVAVDDDMVYDINTGGLWQYDLETNTWAPPTDFFGDKMGFVSHPVRSITSVPGKSGIPDSAVEFRFDWDPLEDLINVFSRGFWANIWFPFPRVPTLNGDVGHIFKRPEFDADNMTFNSKGGVGWNDPPDADGKGSLDLGKCHALHINLKAGFFDALDNEIDFMSNIETGVYFVDKFDRVVIQDAVLERNNQFGDIEIAVGPGAKADLYFNRIEELVKIYPGITHPAFDFKLKEREFTGVTFDWNHVKMIGIFWKGAYDDNGAYAGARDAFVTETEFALEQLRENLIHIFTNPFGFPRGNTQIHHCTLAIDDMYFIKDMYASSETARLDEPIMKVERLESEDDYDNLTINAVALRLRATFNPQMWYITGKGDVKLRRGKRFKAVGPEVPGGEMELVCQEVKHKSNADGYNVDIIGIEKFEPGV